MADDHKCAEQDGKSAYYDGMNGGQVTIDKCTDGQWCAGATDAGIQDIKFCPYCGARLDGKPSKASLMDDVAKSAKAIITSEDTDAHIRLEELVISIVDRYEKLEA